MLPTNYAEYDCPTRLERIRYLHILRPPSLPDGLSIVCSLLADMRLLNSDTQHRVSLRYA